MTMGPKGPESVEQERDRRGDQNCQTLRGTGAEADSRVENGKARVVEDEGHGRDDPKTGQIALDGPPTGGKGPDANEREVEEAVEHKCDAERWVGGDANRQLSRVEGDRQQIAATGDDSITHDLETGMMACRRTRQAENSPHRRRQADCCGK